MEIRGANHFLFSDDGALFNHYLISSIGLPAFSRIDRASQQKPYLGLRLALDPAIVTSTIVESGLAYRQNDSSVKALAVSKLDADLLNACLRLVRLLDSPEQYRVLGPLEHQKRYDRWLRSMKLFERSGLSKGGS